MRDQLVVDNKVGASTERYVPELITLCTINEPFEENAKSGRHELVDDSCTRTPESVCERIHMEIENAWSVIPNAAKPDAFNDEVVEPVNEMHWDECPLIIVSGHMCLC